MLLQPYAAKATRNPSRTLFLIATLMFGMACGVAAQTGSDADANPVKLFEEGQDAHARGDYEKALRFYDAALATHPESAEIEYQRGTALASLQRRAEAEKAFRHAIELRSDWALPYSALGLLLSDNLNSTSSPKLAPRAEEAARLLSRAIELDPNDFKSLATLARLRAQAGSKTDALALLRRATTYPQATAELWMEQARLEREMKELKAAAASAEQALKLDGKNLNARLFRAESLLEIGDTQNLIIELRAAEEQIAATAARNEQTNHAAAYIASIYARLGEESRLKDAQASLSYYRRAVEIDTANAGYATGYAAALVQARRFSEAVEILRRVVADAPETYAAHANLAAALDELKRYSEALVEYHWLKEKRPDIVVTDFFIARAHDLLGQYSEALAAYETFLARATIAQHGLEMEKVNLRLPTLRKQAQQAKGGK